MVAGADAVKQVNFQMFTDLVSSTEQATQLGDRGWRDLLASHHALVRRELGRFHGEERDTAGDGFFATFDGPARAIRCAQEIAERVLDLGLHIRAGVHTGECELIDGKYGGLEAETRGFKGPRAYDATGLPLHFDNQSIFKERIYADKADPNVLHDEITVIDHALTRPWTITKKYRRNAEKHPVWRETVCAENNHHVVIGTENYFLSAEGYLMPAKKDQPPPDLRYFNKARK